MVDVSSQLNNIEVVHFLDLARICSHIILSIAKSWSALTITRGTCLQLVCKFAELMLVLHLESTHKLRGLKSFGVVTVEIFY